MTRYSNPWHNPQDTRSRPFYETDAKPIEYRGFLIYQRIPGVCWDVVRDGQCITQLAGLQGAKDRIDALCGASGDPEAYEPDPLDSAVVESLRREKRFRRFDRVRVRFGTDRGHYGTIISEGGDHGNYYGIRLDCYAEPVGYCDHELDPA